MREFSMNSCSLTKNTEAFNLSSLLGNNEDLKMRSSCNSRQPLLSPKLFRSGRREAL